MLFARGQGSSFLELLQSLIEAAMFGGEFRERVIRAGPGGQCGARFGRPGHIGLGQHVLQGFISSTIRCRASIGNREFA